eukprot:564112-Rhodomonas_salina.2
MRRDRVDRGGKKEKRNEERKPAKRIKKKRRTDKGTVQAGLDAVTVEDNTRMRKIQLQEGNGKGNYAPEGDDLDAMVLAAPLAALVAVPSAASQYAHHYAPTPRSAIAAYHLGRTRITVKLRVAE